VISGMRSVTGEMLKIPSRAFCSSPESSLTPERSVASSDI
jgi:hypothetical protein